MKFRRTTRSGPAFGLALLLALLHAVLLPREAEAQVLDQLKQQAQQAREEVLARQATPETPEDGRFTASFTLGANVHRYSGVAWVSTEGTLWLCPEDAGVRPDRPGMIYADLGKAEEGRYALGVGGRVLVTRQMPAPVGQRTASAPREGSNLTITDVSDRLIAGAFEARYREGVLAAQFRAHVGGPPEGIGPQCRQTQRPKATPDPTPEPQRADAGQAEVGPSQAQTGGDQKQEVLTDKEGEGPPAEQHVQADQTDAGPPAQQASPAAPEEGRYNATHTHVARLDPHGPRVVHHFTGRAFIRPTYGGRFRIDLCDEKPLERQGGARIDVYTETGSVQEGTYSPQLHIARPGTRGNPTLFRTVRGNPRPVLTITSVSDGETAGVITAGGFVQNFEAQFRARDTTHMSDEERREFQTFADSHCH